MKTSRRAFKCNPQSLNEKRTNRDRLESNILFKKNIRGKSDSYHSFAPDNAYVLKRNYLKSILSILLIFSFLFFVMRRFVLNGYDNRLLIMLIVLFVILYWGIKKLKKNIIADLIANDNFKIVLSNEGLNLEGKFYLWNQIEDEEILREGHNKNIRFYLYFRIPVANVFAKFPLEDFEADLRELEYLLHVYRKRHDGKIINKLDKYEFRYMNLSSKRKEKYIIR